VCFTGSRVEPVISFALRFLAYLNYFHAQTLQRLDWPARGTTIQSLILIHCEIIVLPLNGFLRGCPRRESKYVALEIARTSLIQPQHDSFVPSRVLRPNHQTPAFQKWINRLQHPTVHPGESKTDALNHNLHQSRLCQLPDALLRLILSYIRPSGIAMIRITSARFFDLVDEAVHSLHQKDRALLERMIVRHHFKESCRREPALVGSPSSRNSFLCDACHYHHQNPSSCQGSCPTLRNCAHA